MLEGTRIVRRFALIVAMVAAVDLIAKQLAAHLLASGPIPLAGPFALILTHNTGSAFGVTLGKYTWQINVLATAAVLILSMVVLRALSTVDRRAPLALGLVAGAALGNLTSLVLPPAGVADFLSVRTGAGAQMIMNVADLAAYAGLALIVRSVVLVQRAIAADRARPAEAGREREVPIPLFSDAALERRAAALGAAERPSPPISSRDSHSVDRAD